MACYLTSSYRPTKTTRVPAKKENQGNCDAVVQLILKMGTEEKIPYGWILQQSRIYVVSGARPERIHLTLLENRSYAPEGLLPFKCAATLTAPYPSYFANHLRKSSKKICWEKVPSYFTDYTG